MDKQIRFVDLKYLDLLGGLHHLTIPIDNFALKRPFGIDGSSLAGFSSRKDSDLVVIADPKTRSVDPFFEEPTLSFFANIYHPDGSRFEADPRAIIEKAKKKARAYGRPYFQVELEFYIFRRLSVEHWPGGYSVAFESDDSASYHSPLPNDRFSRIRDRISQVLSRLGIPIRYHHHELGPGQQEIELELVPLDRIGDVITLAKYVIKNVCATEGLKASFLAKPLSGAPGSGLHIHHLIRKKGSIFGRKRLTRIGRYYLGGLLTHAPALTPFANPTTNSYRRLRSGDEAPTETSYGASDRTALIRIPGARGEIDFEFRMGDPTANPYLLIPALLAAGIDGITNRIDPDRVEILPLPHNLQTGIEFLRSDFEFLSGILDHDLLDRYLRLIRERADLIDQTPHPKEFELYDGIS